MTYDFEKCPNCEHEHPVSMMFRTMVTKKVMKKVNGKWKEIIKKFMGKVCEGCYMELTDGNHEIRNEIDEVRK